MDKIIMDTIWVLLAAMLVFFMNLGFAMVESGFARAKNCVNILSKNFIVFAVSSLGFLMLGWGLMFGDGNGFIGLKGLFMAGGADNSPAVNEAYQGVYSAISWTGIPFWRSSSFSSYSAEPPQRSCRERWRKESSTFRLSFFPFS